MLRSLRLNPVGPSSQYAALSADQKQALLSIYNYLGQPGANEIRKRGFAHEDAPVSGNLIRALHMKGMLAEITDESGPDFDDITTTNLTRGALAAIADIQKYGTRKNPHRAPNARSMSDLVNADVLEELGYDQAELIGRITETFEGPGFSYSPDHTYVVLLHIPGKGYSVVVFDDESVQYFEGYAGIPDERLAQKAAHYTYSVYSNLTANHNLGRQLVKYRQELG